MRQARFLDPAGTVREGSPVVDGIRAGSRVFPLDDVRFLPPAEPTKIICVGLNYEDHIEEGSYEDAPEIPMLFLKPPNSVAAHRSTVTFPVADNTYEPEAEIAAVIDRQCKDVDASNAMDYVAGLTCGNDLSNRTDQDMEMERRWNFFRGKAFDNAAPLGPYLSDPGNVPGDATLELTVNGETRQQSTRDQMIFSIPELVETVTEYVTLERGDVILTGTTAGVEPIYDGDVVKVIVEGVGTLRNIVREA
jgi:2-keto-4-pentenoate hydratase/2-oxohepta-3-ene-1,7-dioic acid hydratase in catechol pathway